MTFFTHDCMTEEDFCPRVEFVDPHDGIGRYYRLKITPGITFFITAEQLRTLDSIIIAAVPEEEDAPDPNAESPEPDMNADAKATLWDVPEAK